MRPTRPGAANPQAATAAVAPVRAEANGRIPIETWTSAFADLDRPLAFEAVAPGDWRLLDGGRLDHAAAWVPSVSPYSLGDRALCAELGISLPYIGGAMANGIASADLVVALGRAGMLGFFGSAGLLPDRIEREIDAIQSRLGTRPYGFNLIHNPSEPAVEDAVADLYVRRGVTTVSASAYLDLTPAVVRYRLAGLRQAPDGTVVAPNRVVAKVSRIEVAEKFLSPAPARIVSVLLARGDIDETTARLADRIPVATHITVEADSGGHTDNRPAIALVPTMIALRDRLQAQFGYVREPAIGAAGGIATPASVAAAFAMGAAYVLAGSIHQACVEAGTSDTVRQMLADARQADVTMAPAADMFEMGVKVQVLKRGTMFAQRATRLYELYRTHERLEDLPAADVARLERDVFRAPLAEIWEQTQAYFAARDPQQVERAASDPRHKMALVFRWYLGQASGWANRGEPSRKIDYQVWCGPAMGAFNEWTRGSFLAAAEARDAVTVAHNLLYGAAVLARVQIARSQGVPVPAAAAAVPPRSRTELQRYFS